MSEYLQHYKTQLEEVEGILGYKFEDKKLLLRSLVHRSFLHEHTDFPWSHNERLEFLGDAVLELLVTAYLFLEYETRPEGELTAIRAQVVRTESLGRAIMKLGLNKYMLLSTGEAASGGRKKLAILADLFESLLGAMYLDGGVKPCQMFVKKVLFHHVADVVDQELYLDPKTQLQELIQGRIKDTPQYKVLSEAGPDHDKSFVSAVFVDGRQLATGQGSSKKRAEEDAARRALDNLLEDED